MKKEYIQPEVRVCEIEMQTILNSISTNPTPIDETDGFA